MKYKRHFYSLSLYQTGKISFTKYFQHTTIKEKSELGKPNACHKIGILSQLVKPIRSQSPRDYMKFYFCYAVIIVLNLSVTKLLLIGRNCFTKIITMKLLVGI